MRLAVLRPQPGHDATIERIAAAGHEALSLPLFAIVRIAWTPPDPSAFDSLLLTSANAVRMAGVALGDYRHLPVTAVGTATAMAARDAGFVVEAIGGGDGPQALSLLRERGRRRALHLTGRDHRLPETSPIARLIAVYANEALDPGPADLARLAGSVALLHSPRAARHLSALLENTDIARADVMLAAISPAVAQAAGKGWRGVAIADAPDDASVIAAAIAIGAGD